MGQAHHSFGSSHYAQQNPVQTWRQEDVNAIRCNNYALFISYYQTALDCVLKNYVVQH